MTTRNAGRVRDASNVNILNAVRNDASLDYQRRVPAATKGNIKEVADTIFQFSAHKNQFIDSLINRIGLVYARNTVWNNPLAEFKRGLLEYGDTIEEIQTGLIQSKTYNQNRDYLEREIFGRHEIDVRTAFHTVDRQEYYPVTVDENTLRRAFLEQGGLNELTQQIMAAPTTSDNWDEYLLTSSLFKVMNERHAFFNVQVPDVSAMSSTDADARSLLRRLRAMAQKLSFISTQYNAAGMPLAAKPEDLVIFATPEVISGLDVNALAPLFNVGYADVPSRMIPIREEDFGMDGVQAILTTKDFFVIADNSLETTSQFDPVSRTTNYFLHHWEVISASPFAPVVKFSTIAGTEVQKINISDYTVTTWALVDVPDDPDVNGYKMIRGGHAEIVVTRTGTGIEGVEFADTYKVEGAKSRSTCVDNDGVLNIGKDETATSIDVTLTSSYVDPKTGKNVETSSVKTVTIVATEAELNA